MSEELAALRRGRTKRVSEARELHAGPRHSFSPGSSSHPSRQGYVMCVRTWRAAVGSSSTRTSMFGLSRRCKGTQNPLMHFVEHGASEGRDPIAPSA